MNVGLAKAKTPNKVIIFFDACEYYTNMVLSVFKKKKKT